VSRPVPDGDSLAAVRPSPGGEDQLGGRCYYAVILYALVLSGIYALQLR
jgi:hypothetical protein